MRSVAAVQLLRLDRPQREIANALGCGTRHVRRLTNGDSKASWRTRLRAFERFGIEAHDWDLASTDEFANRGHTRPVAARRVANRMMRRTVRLEDADNARLETLRERFSLDGKKFSYSDFCALLVRRGMDDLEKNGLQKELS